MGSVGRPQIFNPEFVFTYGENGVAVINFVVVELYTAVIVRANGIDSRINGVELGLFPGALDL